jgi:hypothetical protein
MSDNHKFNSSLSTAQVDSIDEPIPKSEEDTELAFLLCIIDQPYLVDNFTWLHPNHFHLLKWNYVYTAIQSLHARNEDLNGLSIQNELVKLKTPMNVADIGQLEVPLPGLWGKIQDVGTHAKDIMEAFRFREVKRFSSAMANAPDRRTALALAEQLRTFLAEEYPPAAAKEERFKLLTIEELRNLPPVTYLDDRHHLVAQGLNVLYGESGVGKSYQAFDYSLPLALSDPIVYIAAEGANGCAERIHAWVKHHQVNSYSLNFLVLPEAVNVLQSDDLMLFIARAMAVKPKMIIFDTLARCFAGGDVNSPADMTKFVAAMDKVRHQVETTVLVVAHMGKDKSKGEMGSVILRNSADSRIEMSKDGSLIKLACAKAKYGEKFPDCYLELISIPIGDDVSNAVLIPSDRVVQTTSDTLRGNQAKILEALVVARESDEPATYSRISQLGDIPETSLNRDMKHLIGLNYVHKIGKAYEITDDGEKKLEKNVQRPTTNNNH